MINNYDYGILPSFRKHYSDPDSSARQQPEKLKQVRVEPSSRELKHASEVHFQLFSPARTRQSTDLSNNSAIPVRLSGGVACAPPYS